MQEGGPDDDPEAEDKEEAALEDLEVEVESAVEDASIFPEVGQVNLGVACCLLGRC